MRGAGARGAGAALSCQMPRLVIRVKRITVEGGALAPSLIMRLACIHAGSGADAYTERVPAGLQLLPTTALSDPTHKVTRRGQCTFPAATACHFIPVRCFVMGLRSTLKFVRLRCSLPLGIYPSSLLSFSFFSPLF